MLYKEKKQIIEWLQKYAIENYSLMPDDNYGYLVDVAGNVDLYDTRLTSLSVKFGFISGSFYCNENFLFSLEGCPQTVGLFNCKNNKLTSLEAMPEILGDEFYCDNNPGLGELQKMESLKEIKAYLLSKKLAMELADDLNNQKNNCKIKL